MFQFLKYPGTHFLSDRKVLSHATKGSKGSFLALVLYYKAVPLRSFSSLFRTDLNFPALAGR